jgi:hypothetical protein
MGDGESVGAYFLICKNFTPKPSLSHFQTVSGFDKYTGRADVFGYSIKNFRVAKMMVLE